MLVGSLSAPARSLSSRLLHRSQCATGVGTAATPRLISTHAQAGPSRITLQLHPRRRLLEQRLIAVNYGQRIRNRQVSSQASNSAPLAATSQISSDPPLFSDTTPTPPPLLDAVDASFLDPIVHPIADLLISLPHPLGYGGSIILMTLLIRTAITLPVTLWQRKRAMRAKLLVEPQMKVINDRLAREVMIDSKRKGYSHTRYVAELKLQLAEAQSSLHKKYRTHPFITTWAPLGVHLPIFVIFSLVIRRALELPNSPLAADSFLWLEKLGEVDPQWILPLAGMAVAFGNAEMAGAGGRKMEVKEDLGAGVHKGKIMSNKPATSAAQQNNGPAAKSPTPPRAAQTSRADASTSSRFTNRNIPSPSTPSPPASTPPRPRRITTTSALSASHAPTSRMTKPTPPKPAPTQAPLVDVDEQNRPKTLSPARQAELRRGFFAGALRFSALGFGMIASQMPSGLVLYWFTSLFYSFAQNIVLSWWPKWRAARAKAADVI